MKSHIKTFAERRSFWRLRFPGSASDSVMRQYD
ncbi:MAG: hypothetical protein KZQ77_18335 [Candidatus Thiodiazotropha sp. (ex Notomyrtea botanica)]|nr:hypothetical protein [Candidatus Thiodiazotropha sp. (ex Notomyrtea botanica)]